MQTKGIDKMNIITLQKIKEKFNQAKEYENNIKDKYSTNFKEWAKACDKVNRLKNKYNKAVRQFNYDNNIISTNFIGNLK